MRSLIFQHSCVRVFSRSLEREINCEVLQELSYCVNSLLVHKKAETLAQEIIASDLLTNMLEAVTRNFYAVNYDTKEMLLFAILILMNRTENKEIKARYANTVKCYKNKLLQICMLPKNLKSQCDQLDETVDKLIQECLIFC